MTERNDIDKLLAVGWTEGGNMIASNNPLTGGIIDVNFQSGEWFVIFNNDYLDSCESFKTRDDAIEFVVKIFDL